jgi:hypothetical protein
MKRPTLSRLFCALSLAWLLLGASPNPSCAFEPAASGDISSAATPPCTGDYKPDYRTRYGLSEPDWKALCQSRTTGTPTRTISAPVGQPDDPAVVNGPSADQANRALASGRFNLLFDKSAGGADGSSPVTAPPFRGGADRLPAGTDARNKPQAAGPDAPIDQKQIDKHFPYEPPDSFLSKNLGWFGRLIDNAVVKPIRGAFFSGPEKAYIRSMTDKLQQSEEGRTIIRGIIAENVTVHVQPTNFPGSYVSRKGDLEEIIGTRGEADWDDDSYHFNTKFLDMKDKEAGLESAASNMGHELNHLLLHHQVKSRLPQYDDVLQFALVDEQAARLKGYVVAWEINNGKPNGYIEDGRQIADNPDDFWERMKLWSPAYARCLDLSEMKDPVRSYQARDVAIKGQLDDLDQSGAFISFNLKRIDHMAQAHGYKDNVAELRANTLSEQKSLPSDIKDMRESQQVVEERIKYLNSPAGKAFLGKMKKAAADPQFIQLFNDMQGDLAKLKAFQASKPVPQPKPTPGQMSWDEFDKRWDELHVKAPGQDPPWKERNAH